MKHKKAKRKKKCKLLINFFFVLYACILIWLFRRRRMHTPHTHICIHIITYIYIWPQTHSHINTICNDRDLIMHSAKKPKNWIRNSLFFFFFFFLFAETKIIIIFFFCNENWIRYFFVVDQKQVMCVFSWLKTYTSPRF